MAFKYLESDISTVPSVSGFTEIDVGYEQKKNKFFEKYFKNIKSLSDEQKEKVFKFFEKRLGEDIFNPNLKFSIEKNNENRFTFLASIQKEFSAYGVQQNIGIGISTSADNSDLVITETSGNTSSYTHDIDPLIPSVERYKIAKKFVTSKETMPPELGKEISEENSELMYNANHDKSRRNSLIIDFYKLDPSKVSQGFLDEIALYISIAYRTRANSKLYEKP